ncbi:MAG: flagellar FliJ family protein [Bdellovibrionales bacterium]|nr:flagellar FliJ family protein [Bdellovibrionales bacterium]
MKKAYNLNSRIGKEISDMRMINDNNTFIESLKDQMKDVSIEIQHAETIYQEKHQKLLQLQKKLKQIELHKEKALEDFKQKYKKHSQKLTDEINSRKLGGKNAKSL